MPQRHSYTFKEGLTLMAAKAKSAKDKTALIREAQKEMQGISPAKHPKLVNALQARLLALQGRGQDTEVAHVARGEMVLPRELLTPEVMEFIAAQAQEHGIDPRRLMVGGQASINPATGAEEFGFRDWVTGSFGGSKANAAQPNQVKIDPIEVSATRRSEKPIEQITVSTTNRAGEIDQLRVTPRSLQNTFALDPATHKGADNPQVTSLMTDIARSDQMSGDQIREYQLRAADLLQRGVIDRRTQGKLNQAANIARDESPGVFLKHWTTDTLIQKEKEARKRAEQKTWLDNAPKIFDYFLPPSASIAKDVLAQFSKGDSEKRMRAFENERIARDIRRKTP